jgi:hypothetical protein
MHTSANQAGRPRWPGGRRILLYAVLTLAVLSAVAYLTGIGQSPHVAAARQMALRTSSRTATARARIATALAQRARAAQPGGAAASPAAKAAQPAATSPVATPSPTPAPAPSPTMSQMPTTTPAGLRLVLADNFSGHSLNTKDWAVYDSVGNAGIGLRRPSQVKVADGMLQITAHGLTSGGIGMTSAQTYGLYEFRARSYITKGSWSNILLWPAGGYAAYSKSGEMDIAEGSNYYGTNTFLHDGANGSRIALHFAGDNAQWHTWTFEWLPNSLTLWIDGKQVYRSPAYVAQRYHEPMGLCIQLDIMAPPDGPSASTVNSFDVDWVKVYKLAS